MHPTPRSLLLHLLPRAKAQGAADRFMRYNPRLRGKVLAMLSQYRQSGDPGPLEARIMHAARLTPYGSGREDWPALEKETLRACPQDFINRRARIRIPASTGGTTGVPLKLWRSWESIVAEQIFIDGLLAPRGLSMQSKMAVLRADSVKPTDDTSPPYGRINHGGKRLTLSSPHLNPQTLHWFHDALERFSPSILWVYPSAAANLLTLCDRAGLHLRIPVILASSEMLSATAHRALEEYFHCRVINYYGQAERACFAHGVKPDEFFFDPAYGRVEFTDARPDGDTRQAAKIIGTSYWNTAMPLIRYDTGDLLHVPGHYGQQELAEIAQGTRPFAGLAGREGEYVLTQDGMRIIGLNQIPRDIEHVLQMQLVQTGYDHVQIDILALPGFSDRDARRIEQNARAKLPASMSVSVQRAERLRTTPRGKTPLAVRDFPLA